MKYYWIRATEDGAMIEEFNTAEELIKEIKSNYEDTIYEEKYVKFFLNGLPDCNLYDWHENNMVIIHGEIIMPKIKEIIKDIEI